MLGIGGVMKMSIDEFVSFIKYASFVDKQRNEIYDCEPVTVYDDKNGAEIEAELISGFVEITTTCDIYPQIVFTYTEGYSYIKNAPWTFEHGTDGQSIIWDIKGLTVIGDDGEIMSPNEIAAYLPSYFSCPFYGEIREGIIDLMLINSISDTFKDKVFLPCEYNPTIVAYCELIGFACTSMNSGSSSYSGRPGECTEFKLYAWDRGFIAHRAELSIWQGSRDRYYTRICSDISEVVDFFGDGVLAIELYDDAGLDI